MAKTTEKKQTEDSGKTQVQKAREELFQLKLDHSMRKLKNTRSLFLKRKEIARLLTTMHKSVRQAQDGKEVTNNG